ncbi:MAG: ligase-associated DNA damage response endonuclease PdeM [Verrucomicrobiaceae bacterium]
MHLTLHGHQLELLSDHAVHLPASSALVLSDVHLGKAATFQAHGIAIPEGDNARDLARISTLLAHTKATRLIIAGDLFHSAQGHCPELSSWLAQCPADLTLVIGNHDLRGLPQDFPAKASPSLILDGIEIVHDPADASPDKFTICGHLHPSVKIKEGPRRSLRTPCFHLTGTTLILPSFGSFTGGQIVKRTPQDRIFIPLPTSVLEAPAHLLT